MKQGKIIKGIAGFYYIHIAGSGIYECRAKGVFRKDNIKPLVGDDVMIEILDEKERKGSLAEILPRRNALIRPASANVDQALILFSYRSPDPKPMLLDRFLAAMGRAGIPVIIAFNKCDLVPEQERQWFFDNYRGAGCPIFELSVARQIGLSALREVLKGKTTVLAGPSGVGKSSLTNALQDEIVMETGEISRKLMRGKNTTRHAQIIPLGEDSYLMDTPGFTAFEMGQIAKDELRFYYPEFAPYEGRCYYPGCVHLHEPDCAVKEALAQGKISDLRYRNYEALYQELADIEKRRY